MSYDWSNKLYKLKIIFKVPAKRIFVFFFMQIHSYVFFIEPLCLLM